MRRRSRGVYVGMFDGVGREIISCGTEKICREGVARQKY
jgi:hypothetical protein